MHRNFSLALSSAKYWGHLNGCTGYPRMVMNVERTPNSPSQAEGINAHKIAAALIDPQNHSLSDTDMSEKTMHAVDFYLKEVSATMQSVPLENMVYGVETEVTASRISSIANGIIDFWLYSPQTRQLFIFDYKHGRSAVEVKDNSTLVGYYEGLSEKLGINGYEDQHLKVHFKIVQPNAYHEDGETREWVVTASDLRAMINIMSGNATEAENGGVCRSGEHCKHCPALHFCSAGINAGIGMYEATSRPAPVNITPSALGAQYALIKRAAAHIKSLETAVTAQMEVTMRKGVKVPGFATKSKKGKLKWSQDVDAVIAMGKCFKVELAQPTDVITPTQAKALGIDDNVIKQYSERPEAGFKIVSDSDKLKEANKVFKT